MSEMPVSEARDHFSDVVSRASQGESTYLMRHGRRVAAVVPMSIIEEWEAAEDAADLAAAEAALAEDGPLVRVDGGCCGSGSATIGSCTSSATTSSSCWS